MADHFAQPTGEISRRRRKASHSGQIEVGVSVYESGENGRIPEVAIRRPRAMRLDAYDLLAVNHQHAALDRRAGDREYPTCADDEHAMPPKATVRWNIWRGRVVRAGIALDFT
jgi:hypothetical protein